VILTHREGLPSLVILLALSIAPSWGCSAEAADDASATAGASAGGGGSTAAAGGACTSLTLAGPSVAPTAMQGERPAPAGGTLADGVYDLVEYRVYGTLEGESVSRLRQTTIRLANGVRSAEMISAAADEALDHYAFDVSIEGSKMVTTVTCPEEHAGKREGGSFSATAAEFWGFGDSNDINVYRKRTP
jgi:hypothetical protein